MENGVTKLDLTNLNQSADDNSTVDGKVDLTTHNNDGDSNINTGDNTSVNPVNNSDNQPNTTINTDEGVNNSDDTVIDTNSDMSDHSDTSIMIDTDDAYAGFGAADDGDDDGNADDTIDTNTSGDNLITKNIPENLHDLIKFMEDTGGSLEDYVRLNVDVEKLDNESLLKTYYKKTKPHLNDEEIEFLMEDTFAYDEDLDDERDVRKKKLALKEEVTKAKSFLQDIKNDYYKEVKSTAKLSPEHKEAVEFYEKYKAESTVQTVEHKQRMDHFLNETKKVFEDFKGFDFKVGGMEMKFNVKNPKAVMEYQSSLDNFVKEFLDDKNNIKDPVGYHKALFAAKNADVLAQHFYEKGKADAIKEDAAVSKNINMDNRRTHSDSTIPSSGVTVKVLDDSSPSQYKIKKK
jgi:hypothetical protein